MHQAPGMRSLVPRFIVAALLSIALAAAPAQALEGRVVDRAGGHGLANVEITVVGRTDRTRTGPDGRFVLVPDPRPPFELLLILPGGRYSKPILVERLPEDGPLEVRVEPFVTDALTVTAGAAPTIHTAPAAGSTLVTREDMRARQPRNVSEALENVPGVSNVSEGHASVPAIRGMAQARSLVLIDGSRVTAERRIGPSATFVDPFVLEGIEVARGPGSVAYGSDAFGGVILARTRRPRPGGDLSITASAGLGAGVPQGRAGVEIETGLDEQSGILFSAHYREFTDYDSPDGEVQNSGSRDHGFLGSYTRLLGGGVFSLAFQADRGREIERPRTNSDVTRFYYPGEDSNRLTASFETGTVGGFDSTKLSLFLGDKRIITDQDTFATATEPRSVERADVTASDFGIRGVAQRHLGQTRIEFGLDVNGRYDLEAEDVVLSFDTSGQLVQQDVMPTIDNARRIDLGVFASAEGAIGPTVALEGGVRFDRVESKNRGGFFGNVSVDHSEPSGYAAITFGPFAGFSTTLQYSRGFRDARLSDRFFRGVTGAGFITGNPDLQPETSDQYDLGVRYSAGRWRAALYLYDYRIRDLIERFEDPLQADFFFFRNRGRAKIRGIEVEARAELPARVSLQIAANLGDGEALDGGTPLDDIQQGRLSLQARKALGSSFFVQLRGAYHAEQDEPGPTEVAVDDYTVFDLSAGWDLGDRVELQLLVRNLLDESYALSTDRLSPLAPGISGYLGIRATF